MTSKTRGNRPDFLCIGPSKTGTSWLYANLKHHPDIKLPPVKEMHYFWGCGDPRKMYLGLNPGFITRLAGSISMQRRKIYFRHRIKPVLQDPRRMDIRKLQTHIKYLAMPQSDLWYRSFFPNDYISGDIDEVYFFFQRKHIETLLARRPNIRVFVQVREPVDRFWSYVRMYFYHMKGKDMGSIHDSKITKRFMKTYASFPNYSEVIELWREYLDQDQFRVMFYDDLVADSLGYLNDVCDFLGAGAFDHWPQSVAKRVFKNVEYDMPELLQRLALELHLEEYDRLDDLLESKYPAKWKSEAERKIHALTG